MTKTRKLRFKGHHAKIFIEVEEETTGGKKVKKNKPVGSIDSFDVTVEEGIDTYYEVGSADPIKVYAERNITGSISKGFIETHLIWDRLHNTDGSRKNITVDEIFYGFTIVAELSDFRTITLTGVGYERY